MALTATKDVSFTRTLFGQSRAHHIELTRGLAPQTEAVGLAHYKASFCPSDPAGNWSTTATVTSVGTDSAIHDTQPSEQWQHYSTPRMEARRLK